MCMSVQKHVYLDRSWAAVLASKGDAVDTAAVSPDKDEHEDAANDAAAAGEDDEGEL